MSAPLRDMRALMGASDASPDTVAALADVRHALGGVSRAAGRSWEAAQAGWTGAAADAAGDFIRTTVAALDALSLRAEQLHATAALAADAVARARARLDGIIAEFEARVDALEATLDSPGAAEELADETRRALAEASAVIDELTVELDSHTAHVAAPAGPTAPAPPSREAQGWGTGSGMGAGAGLSAGGGLGSSAVPFSAAPFTVPFSGSPDMAMASAADRPGPDVATSDPGVFGSGVAVHLPGGATALAPNAVAASAVRHALTQLGVPYDWGGTTAGVGLDCSGLTQWAYREAGLELPRLAQEQDIGSTVDRGSLRPGDLAVWDGHVAMIVGDGLMVEAGDPVQLSPIRTTNAGQGFQGFWRPTA
jgi:cell wall-associated NlpC family hydrolase